MRRRLGLLLAGALVAMTVSSPAGAQTDGAQPRAWIVVDLDTGAVLDGSNVHEALPVAGLAKVMTALTALQRLPYESRVTSGEAAAGVSGTRIGVGAGEDWGLRDLMRPMLLSGADDAAYAIAEGAAGSLEAFANDMATVGQSIGVEDSTFNDPSGIDDATAFPAPTLMSAYDLAVVGRNFLAVPELAEEVAKTGTVYIDASGVEVDITNTNNFTVTYPGATGIRQSQSTAAGGTVLASASRDGRNLLVAALGTDNPSDFAAATLDAQFAAAADTPGTGETLPDVRLSSAQLNQQAITALPAPLGGGGISLGPPGEVTLTPETTPPTEAPPPEERGGEGGGVLTWTNVGLVALVLLTAVLLLRRRAILREQRRRAAGAERFHNARRRKALDIIEPQTHDAGGHVNVIRK